MTATADRTAVRRLRALCPVPHEAGMRALCPAHGAQCGWREAGGQERAFLAARHSLQRLGGEKPCFSKKAASLAVKSKSAWHSRHVNVLMPVSAAGGPRAVCNSLWPTHARDVSMCLLA